MPSQAPNRAGQLELSSTHGEKTESAASIEPCAPVKGGCSNDSCLNVTPGRLGNRYARTRFATAGAVVAQHRTVRRHATRDEHALHAPTIPWVSEARSLMRSPRGARSIS
eukprot:6178077-Pleurochrysis_carterae.AAC.1